MFSPSEAEAPAAILDQKLSAFGSGWFLFADCRCKTAQILLDVAARQHGAEQSLMALILRLRCRRCGEMPRRTRIGSVPRPNTPNLMIELTG